MNMYKYKEIEEREARKRRSVYNTTNKNMGLENLPDHVIHQIMDFLPYEQAAKFSVLSKSFYSSWLLFPTIHFSYESTFSSEVLYQTFFNVVQKTLQLRGPYIKGSLHSLSLSYIERQRPSSHHYPKVFDVLLNFAIKNNVKELNFHLEMRGVNWNYDPLRSLFSSQFLTVLKLAGVKVPLVDAFITCPKLKELVFQCCEGFQTINVLSSSSLKKVRMGCQGLEAFQILLEGKSLKSFMSEGHEYDELRQLTLDVEFCHALKVLKLIDATTITEDFNCSLKKLSLNVHTGTFELDEIAIDAPNLLEFYYVHGAQWFPNLITSAKCSANISLLPPYVTSFIYNLRDFLCCFNHFKDLSISCSIFEHMIFTKQHLHHLVNVSSLYDLRHLKVEASDDPVPNGPNLIKLLKSLLKLVPKPWTITLYSRSTKITNTLKFKYGKKVEMTNSKVGECCYNAAIKCWRHYEVEIEFQGFDESVTEYLNKFFAHKVRYYGIYRDSA